MIKKGGIEGKLTGLSNSAGKVKTAAVTINVSPRYKTVCLYLLQTSCQLWRSPIMHLAVANDVTLL
jgi:hypothetical protein